MDMTFSWKSARIPFFLVVFSKELDHSGQVGAVLPSLRREEEEHTVMLGSLGALYTLGQVVDWSRIYPAAGGAFDSHCTHGSASVVGLRARQRTATLTVGQVPDERYGEASAPGPAFQIATSCGNSLLGSHFGQGRPALSG